jgi:NADH-quinone oxidoreductase subunit C
MTADEIVQLLEQQFGPKITGKKLDALDPEPAALAEVAEFLRDDERLRFDSLQCISGVDYLEPDAKKAARAGFEPHVEVVYHLYSYPHRHRFVIKAILPRWNGDRQGELPEVPTITHLYGTAIWHERETYDLVGVRFVGHANLRRILCPDDWVGHPLRKDYEMPLEYHGIRGK